MLLMENKKDLKQEILSFIGDREVRYADIQKKFGSNYTPGAITGALGTMKKKNMISTRARGIYRQNISIVQTLKNDIDMVLKKYDLNIIINNPDEANEFINLYKKLQELSQ